MLGTVFSSPPPSPDSRRCPRRVANRPPRPPDSTSRSRSSCFANGLTLIVHEDHKAPIVAVNVWYHVGSKNEKPGQDRLRAPLRAPDVQRQRELQRRLLQGDRARRRHRPERHHQRRPHQLLPERARRRRSTWSCGSSPIAWGTCSARIDQARLDEQRGVVQNEKRQGENQPYGSDAAPAHREHLSRRASLLLDDDRLDGGSRRRLARGRAASGSAPTTAPPTPCSSWPATSRAEEVRARVEQLLRRDSCRPAGRQARGLDRQDAAATHRQRDAGSRAAGADLQGLERSRDTALPRLDHLDLASDVLAGGKTSRLYKRLVYDEQIATDVAAFISPREIGSQFCIVATAKPGGDLAAVEQAIDEELRGFLETGPTPDELERVKPAYTASLRSRHRAHRRLRRQVRPARAERGLRRRPGGLQDRRSTRHETATPRRSPTVGARAG